MGKAKKATSSKATRAAPRTKDAVVHLFDLPESCLQRIVGHMDGSTRIRFFRASKGSGERPGCAMLVVKTCKPTYTLVAFRSQQIDSQLARPSKMLHWVSQHSSNVHVRIFGSDEFVPSLDDILGRLLVFQEQHKDCPVRYPGVTSLEVKDCQISAIIPCRVDYAFPNLTRLSISSTCPKMVWFSDEAEVVEGGVADRIQHLTLKAENSSITGRFHVETQLSCMDSLTSLDTVEEVLLAAPARVLNKLTELVLTSKARPQPKTRAALYICINLRRLTLCLGSRHLSSWLAILPRGEPDMNCELRLPTSATLDAEALLHLLALPDVTQLRFHSLDQLPVDYSRASCRWQQLSFSGPCNSYITRLPLHTLNSPIGCSEFCFHPSADHAADIAVATAARPHLLRCGGISVDWSDMRFDTSDSPTITKEQAPELLEAWAPCFPSAIHIITGTGPRARAVLGAARAWPNVEVVVGY